MIRNLSSLLLLIVSAGLFSTRLTQAQVLPTKRPAHPDASGDPRAVMLEAAERALLSGDREQALEHLMRALWLRPQDPAVLERVLGVELDDPDRRALWSHAYFAAASDLKGSVRLPAAQRRRLFDAQDHQVKTISRARAQAGAELVRRLDRGFGSASLGAGIERRWLRLVAHELVADCPGLYEAYGERINAAAAPQELSEFEPIIDALQEILRDGLAEERPEQALTAARLIQGLVAQAGFKDLKGPRPRPFSRELIEAREGLVEARLKLLREARLWSVAELEALTPEQRLEFTRAHTSFEHPALALSPGGHYRIETTCGHGTLLAAAKSVELHHRRLVSWYGRDPFEQRQGVVRIVPDAAGLEAEGEPFWWAGGFQSGDLTTVRFTAGSLASLSPLLTHELTHRFDGAVYPGLPAWLAEGRAVWTEESFERTTDTVLLENRVDTSRLERARLKQYGRIGPLRELLDGAIEEYRDNYQAGYALFLFLYTWMKDDRYIYRSVLERFELSCVGTEASAHRFELEFCDGEQGRPDGLERFADQFERFLREFLPSNSKPFGGRYRRELFREIGLPIYDAPIWTFDRKRAEPWFGQELAARAGLALLRFGRREAAARALVWALGVDEWSAVRTLLLADLLDEFGEPGPAWVLRSENHRRAARGAGPPGRSPALDRLPKTRTYLAALERAAGVYQEQAWTLSAAALRADRNRLAALFGVEPVVSRSPLPGTLPGAALDGPPHALGLHGWIEDGLTDYEELRVAGLWYATDDGQLHVGRRKPRAGTGQMDRIAGADQAFVRSKLWLPPGRQRLEMTIHFTSAYVEGAVILGYTRRDRNIRFTFRGGDREFLVGGRDQPAAFEFIDCELHGIRDAESAFAGQTVKSTFRFSTPATSFRLVFLIDHATVLVSVNGKEVGSYHSPDGQPLEGPVGFAVKRGAIQVEHPTVERFRRRQFSGRDGSRTRGLQLEDAGPTTLSKMIHRPVFGFETPKEGALLFWVPSPSEADAQAGRNLSSEALRTVLALDGKLREQRLLTPLVMVLPQTLAEQESAELRAHLTRELSRKVLFLVHRKSVPLAKLDDAFPVPIPMALFVDPHGVVRCMSPCRAEMAILPHELTHWLSIYR